MFFLRLKSGKKILKLKKVSLKNIVISKYKLHLLYYTNISSVFFGFITIQNKNIFNDLLMEFISREVGAII